MSAVLQEGPKPGEQGGIEVTRVLPGQESLLTPAALAKVAAASPRQSPPPPIDDVGASGPAAPGGQLCVPPAKVDTFERHPNGVPVLRSVGDRLKPLLAGMTADLAHPILVGEGLAAQVGGIGLKSMGVFLLDGLRVPHHVYAPPISAAPTVQ